MVPSLALAGHAGRISHQGLLLNVLVFCYGNAPRMCWTSVTVTLLSEGKTGRFVVADTIEVRPCTAAPCLDEKS
jgi:hypothetical protein